MLPIVPKIACHHLGLDIPNPVNQLLCWVDSPHLAAQGIIILCMYVIYITNLFSRIDHRQNRTGQTPFSILSHSLKKLTNIVPFQKNTQAITQMTRQLRDNKTKIGPKTGLVLANGGNLTYQHVIILSSKPRSLAQRYPTSNTYRM